MNSRLVAADGRERLSQNAAQSDASYVGYLDWANCETIYGWAADRNRLNQSINVAIYDGATLMGTVLANVSRPDAGRFLGDNGLHGFTFATPVGLKDGQRHLITVKYESSELELGTTPKSLRCAPANYVGYLDAATCDTIYGWAADRDRLNQSISVGIYDGTSLIATVLAKGLRRDAGSSLKDNGLHGFTLATPASLKNGQPHSITAKYESTGTELGSAPKSLICQPPSYVGNLDVVNCGTIQGWAADRNRLNQSISVSIYDGTTLLTTVLANSSRPDVGSYLGDNGLHGFTISTPASLKDGKAHSINAAYESSSASLDLNGKPLTCTNSRATVQIEGTKFFGPRQDYGF